MTGVQENEMTGIQENALLVQEQPEQPMVEEQHENKSVNDDDITLTDYVKVDSENSENVEDSNESKDKMEDSVSEAPAVPEVANVKNVEIEPPKELENISFVLGDSSLITKLKSAVPKYELNHMEEAKYAIEMFYENIQHKWMVQYEKRNDWHVFSSSGKKGHVVNGYSTNERIWKSLQNQNIRGLAINLCAKEGVLLILEYGNDRKEWSWEMSIPCN